MSDSKVGDHFGCTLGVLVNQDCDSAVKLAWAESFGEQGDRAVAVKELEPEKHSDQAELCRWNVVNSDQAVLSVPLLSHLAADIEHNLAAVGAERAHRSQ